MSHLRLLLPHEHHGKADYLTIEDLEKSAAINSYDLDQAVENLIATVAKAKKETKHNHK